MELTNENIELFIELGEKTEVLTITGINGYNQAFETKGVLLAKKKDGKLYYMNDHCFALYLGQNNIHYDDILNFITIHTEFDNSSMSVPLYVNEIKNSKGEVVFKNEDFSYIAQAVEGELKEEREQGNYYGDISSLALSFTSLIGKPVKVYQDKDEQNLALKGIKHYKTGDSLDLSSGTHYHGMPLYYTHLELDQDAVDKIEAINEQNHAGDNSEME